MAQPITSAVAITSGQEKQLVRFVADAAESAAKTAVAQADFLDKDGAQLVIVRGDELKVAIERATINALKQLSSRYPMLVETKLLKPVAKATVPARTKPFNAAAFYQTGTGIYVFSTVAQRLDLHAMKTVDSAPERPYVALLLKENAYDTDIRKELPKMQLSTPEDVAGLIEAQPNGKSGFLLNNGCEHIFHIEDRNGEVFAMRVLMPSTFDHGEWLVDSWEFGEDGYWNAGCLFLCPGNATL